MKLSIRDRIPTLHIIIEVDESAENVAASVEFKEMIHPNVRRKFKKSDDWLKHVNDLARSIYGSMEARNFDIFKAQPSKKSYTYYLGFRPADKEGNLWDQELGFQIELRDHVSTTHEPSGQVTEKLIVKTYYLENKSYRDMMSILREVWKILDDVQNGDFSSFTS